MEHLMEFYFVRHGQTDHNISPSRTRTDQPADIPLNETGRAQAKQIAPIIESLPIQTLCASPLRRVQETKELIAPNLRVPYRAIPELGECGAATWNAMAEMGMYYPLPEDGIVRAFMDRVQKGLHEALAQPGPTLIIAHGGVHWALCCLLGIQDHSWAVPNCAPVHFVQKEGKWVATKL